MGKWSTYRRRGTASQAGPAPNPTPITDLIATAAANGYSITRKLRAGYAGSAFRIQRSSDNATLDVGFLGTDLTDIPSAQTFVGAATGRIVTLYDNCGSRNLTVQVSDFGNLIVAGVLQTDTGGRPCVNVSDNAGDIRNTGIGFAVLPATCFNVLIPMSSIASGACFARITSSGSSGALVEVSASNIELRNGSSLTGAAIVIGTQYVVTWQLTSGTDFVQLGSGSATSGNAGNNTPDALGIGTGTAGGTALSKHSEWLVYSAALSGGDISTLQANLLAFYA